MSKCVIRAENLGKRYIIGKRESYKTLRDTISEAFCSPFRKVRSFFVPSRRPVPDIIWALKDVGFEINEGEVVGIIGRNGAGKSTLLKILSRITEPTEGSVVINGRLGSLLEVGTGFHPELTGRENIYLNGAILGMRRTEIERKFDEIVAFAEVEKFLDTPVKRYSSGMYVRLAFAVAAHLEPEILLVDEVLAVGDIGFQEKCLGKMGEVSRQGRTVLFVSHNLNAIWSLCPKTLWFDNGELVMFGNSAEVIDKYRNAMRLKTNTSLQDVPRSGNGKLRITSIYLEDNNGEVCTSVRTGEDIKFVLEYAAEPGVKLDDLAVKIFVSNDREVRLFVLSNIITNHRFNDLPPKGRLKCRVLNIPLLPGEYILTSLCSIKNELVDKMLRAGNFLVIEGDFFDSGRLPHRSWGEMLVKQSWNVEEC